MKNSIVCFSLLLILAFLGGCTGRTGTDYFKNNPEITIAIKDKNYKQAVKIDLARELGRFDYENSAKPVFEINDSKRTILNRYGEGIKPVSVYKGVKVAIINPQGEVVDIGNPMPFIDPLTYIPIVGELYEMLVHLVILDIPTWIAGGGETVIPSGHYSLMMKKSEFSKSKIKKGDKITIIHDDAPLDFKDSFICKLNDGSTDNYLISFEVPNVGANATNFKGKLFLTKENDQAQDLAKIQILEKELNGVKNASGDLVFSDKGLFGYSNQYSLTLHKGNNLLLPYEKISIQGLNCSQKLELAFNQNDYLTNKTLFFVNENLDFGQNSKQIIADKQKHDGKVLSAIERKKEEQRQIALAFKAKQEALKRISDFYQNYTVKVVGKSAGSISVSGGIDRVFPPFINYITGVDGRVCKNYSYNIAINRKSGAKFKEAKINFYLKNEIANNSITEIINLSAGNISKKLDMGCINEYYEYLSRGGSHTIKEAKKMQLSYEVIQVD